VLRSYLGQAGFEVLTASRGDTGLSTWEHKRPDLVLLDLNLPGMDGLDVARNPPQSQYPHHHAHCAVEKPTG
jgi:two-component system alkaline phosphatase synthesis response regulator PhoP